MDTIADTLTRIKNAYLARHQTVEMPDAKIREAIVKILVKEGYLEKSKVKSQKSKLKTIICELKYEKERPALTEAKRISKPGRRVYCRWEKMPRDSGNYHLTIISTSKGLITSREARKRKLGGELICQIW